MVTIETRIVVLHLSIRCSKPLPVMNCVEVHSFDTVKKATILNRISLMSFKGG